MAMDIIFKNETNFDKGNNFSIDLTSNNYIQDMVFKGKEKWLISGLELKIETIETKAEYSAIKKVSDLINSVKKSKNNEIKHRSFHTKLPNFKHFDHDNLVNYSLPE